MTVTQCKYSNERLAQMAKERGLDAIIVEIAPSAIADRATRGLWERIHNSLDELSEKLQVQA